MFRSDELCWHRSPIRQTDTYCLESHHRCTITTHVLMDHGQRRIGSFDGESTRASISFYR